MNRRLPKLFANCLAVLAMSGAATVAYADGVPVIDASDVASLGTVNRFGSTSSVTDVSGEPFDKAIQVSIASASITPWDIELDQKTIAPVSAGDALLFTFWVKADSPLDGSARILGAFQNASAPFNKPGILVLSPPGVWTKVELPFKSDADYAPGEAEICFHLAYQKQVVELGGITVTDYGKDVDVNSLPRTGLTYQGRDPNAPWRQQAERNIDRYRKADVKIDVVDQYGKPLAGAVVDAKMLRHTFTFGTCVNERWLQKTGPDADAYRDKLASLFTIATPEGSLKWPSWDGNRSRGIATVDWLSAHGIAIRGHNLVWPGWKYQTKALKASYDAALAASGEDAAAKLLSDAIDAHITDELTALKGKCVEWDVVNEPVEQHDFQDILGPDAEAHWYRVAHSVDPDARLFVNDDGNIYGQTSDARVEQSLTNTRSLIAAGAPLGGIGLESHMSAWSLPSVDQINASLNAYAQFHLPMRITEYDITNGSDDLAADFTRDYVTLCFSNPNVTGFTMWGFWDGSHWLGYAPLYRKDWTLKPSGVAFTDLVFNKWWTNVAGTTDRAGAYGFRGFDGTYTITATIHGKTESKVVQVGPDATKVTITVD